jgi:hypothetical protein
MAGHVGQTALDRIADGGIAAAAELDQHVAAVRAELTVCQQLPGASAHLAADRSTGGRPATRRRLRRLHGRYRKDRYGHGDCASDLLTRLGMLRSSTVTCPDVPFVSDACRAAATVPVTLLLHYASGFVEAGIGSGWWPGQSAGATDWASLRLAAICKLIRQAEAAAEAHPDLREIA